MSISVLRNDSGVKVEVACTMVGIVMLPLVPPLTFAGAAHQATHQASLPSFLRRKNTYWYVVGV